MLDKSRFVSRSTGFLMRCCGLAAAVGVTMSASASVGVQAQINGFLIYPESGPGSIGNELQVSFSDQSGYLAGAQIASASIANSAQGVDGNGTTGNALVSGWATAEYGTLRAQGGVTASSQATPLAPFPHATSSLNPGGSTVAQFWDDVTIFDPTVRLGDTVTATVTLRLDWSGSITSGPNQRGNTGATAVGGLQFIGSLSNYLFRDSSGNITNRPQESLTFQVPNGTVVGASASLAVFCGVNVFGGSLDQIDCAAGTDASHTLHFFIDGANASLTAIGQSGHNYSSGILAGCAADFNGDGTLDPDDLADFIGGYFAQPPAAGSDFNSDGNTDPDDLADFIGAYFAGCP